MIEVFLSPLLALYPPLCIRPRFLFTAGHINLPLVSAEIPQGTHQHHAIFCSLATTHQPSRKTQVSKEPLEKKNFVIIYEGQKKSRFSRTVLQSFRRERNNIKKGTAEDVPTVENNTKSI